MKKFSHTSGFTLVEIILSITIFSVMSIAITSLYIQTTYIGQKMRNTRFLSETAREITERIADDVREKGIASGISIDASYPLWKKYDFTNGSEYIALGDGGRRYVYGKKSILGPIVSMSPCVDNYGSSTDLVKTDTKIHCGLYRVDGTNYADALNLVDSFIPEENKKRVKVEDMKFYISGDGISSEKKVTLVFTLALMPRIGIPPSLVSETRMHIQTTISERFFKNDK